MPPGTELLDVRVDSTGVHLDFNESFRTTTWGSGFTQAQTGVVLATASSPFDPDVPVWLAIEGDPLGELGGAIVVDYPTTQAEWIAADEFGRLNE
jgi:spore germination protein GerM